MPHRRNPSGITFSRRVLSPVRAFINDSRSTGITLICCTLVSLLVANGSAGSSFLHFWELNMPAAGIQLPHTPLHFINDFLMATFFLLAGLEIRRELITGELAHRKRALLPAFAALGGMLLPAGIYLLCNTGTSFSQGWGIPMATDIAFSLGVLSLLGTRAPVPLRIFLTALAIIDDLGGIVTIAVFYAGQIHWPYLGLAGLVLLLLALFNKLRFRRLYLYLIPGLLLWYFIYNSGIHATVAGVLLAFCMPLRRIGEVEHALHKPVHFLILPLFALANTAIVLPPHWTEAFRSPVYRGIFLGLLPGKALGIVLFSLIAVKTKLAALPQHTTWWQMTGVGLIAGIGFTMSIFITTLAFPQPELQLVAKISILCASLPAGLLGYGLLRTTVPRKA